MHESPPIEGFLALLEKSQRRALCFSYLPYGLRMETNPPVNRPGLGFLGLGHREEPPRRSDRAINGLDLAPELVPLAEPDRLILDLDQGKGFRLKLGELRLKFVSVELKLPDLCRDLDRVHRALS